jgi:hypothetical protein
MARVCLAFLLLLALVVGVVAWALLVPPAGAVGCVFGLAVSGALIVAVLYALCSTVLRSKH